MKLANSIRRCRFEKQEMSQEKLAREIGVTRQTIHSIEKGKFVPSVVLALKLSEYFGKPVEELFYFTDQQ